MVTKLERLVLDLTRCSVLAKILMVTKLIVRKGGSHMSSVLAKILMVTKLTGLVNEHFEGSVLAKILMVTKQS